MFTEDYMRVVTAAFARLSQDLGMADPEPPPPPTRLERYEAWGTDSVVICQENKHPSRINKPADFSTPSASQFVLQFKYEQRYTTDSRAG